MTKELFSLPLEAFYSPLTHIPSGDGEDLMEANREPKQLTSRLHEMVPLLKFVGFQLETVSEHETVAVVPLLASAMNQNGTHQASIFYLMADYIAGVAVWSSLVGTYTTEVHDRGSGQPVQFWLKSNSVIHLGPGTGLIRGRTVIDQNLIPTLRDRLSTKGRCDVPLFVEIFQGKDLIATAEPIIGVYLDTPRLPDHKADFFQRENAKLSAKMIAGIRPDSDSQAVAGEQGRALALRFAEVTPQLPHMIEARGLHLKRHLMEQGDAYAQVVVLGIGLDTNPLTCMKPGQQWFGVDLRQTLQVRKEQFQLVGGDASTLTLVAADLRLNKWNQTLLDAGYNPARSTLFVMEGFTPYLHAPELERLLAGIYALCQHPKSRLWFDHVTPALFQLEHPEVQGFLSAISRLGEPFVTGFKDVQVISDRWRTIEQCKAEDMLNGSVAPHPVYAEHLMSLLVPVPEKGKRGRFPFLKFKVGGDDWGLRIRVLSPTSLSGIHFVVSAEEEAATLDPRLQKSGMTRLGGGGVGIVLGQLLNPSNPKPH